MTILYGCKAAGPSGLAYLSTEPCRHWKPIQTYQTPQFQMPCRMDNNDPILVEGSTFWQRRFNRLAYNTRKPIESKAINKPTNLTVSIAYVPCKELLEFFETLQIVRLEVKPNQVTTEELLDMGKFKTLNRSVMKLRLSMEDAGLI